VYHLPFSQPSPRTAGDLGPIGPGQWYPASTYSQVEDHSDGCACNTVVYSLLSACGACQGGRWLTYVPHQPLAYWDHIFLAGMITLFPAVTPLVLPHSELTVTRGFLVLIYGLPSYREPIPNGTFVPYWALIDVTVRRLIFRLPTRCVLTAHPRSTAPGIPN
jgi:hypothetical protein